VKVFPHEFKRVMKKDAQHETVTRRVAAGHQSSAGELVAVFSKALNG
jgi:hypothetical protein